MPRNTLVESIDNVEYNMHLPGFSVMVPLYDTSFPISVGWCTRMTLFCCPVVPLGALGDGYRQWSTQQFLLEAAPLSVPSLPLFLPTKSAVSLKHRR